MTYMYIRDINTIIITVVFLVSTHGHLLTGSGRLPGTLWYNNYYLAQQSQLTNNHISSIYKASFN